ncbi:hypothetical protein GE061_015175 [Apolygus lucorum]|uniref:Uncharacterized protein n=1 Tax=Apolygus lucorum TaxID=248454 RepID=A0A8S9XMF8_APOLU|nr:hypothetical protein GE061_015175 [Apolygus lucorum]
MMMAPQIKYQLILLTNSHRNRSFCRLSYLNCGHQDNKTRIQRSAFRQRLVSKTLDQASLPSKQASQAMDQASKYEDQAEMSLQRTEQVEDMEEDPPIDEFIKQVYDTFQEETDAYGTISKEHVTTPEPCNAPEKTLAGIVDCIRYAANGHSYMTRAANSQAAIVAMLKVTRWIPQYQRIAVERDRLLERREKWRTERAKLLKERAEAWKEIQELKRRLGLQSVEPPAAKATNDSSKVRPQSLNRPPRADTPATSESLDESPTRPRATPRKTPKSESPKQSTSRARSPTPELRPRQSPTRPISPFQTVIKSPPPKARRGSESGSTSPSEEIEEESYLPKNMEEPQVETRTSSSSNKSVPKLILKKCKPSAAKQHKKKKIRCPICCKPLKSHCI